LQVARFGAVDCAITCRGADAFIAAALAIPSAWTVLAPQRCK